MKHLVTLFFFISAFGLTSTAQVTEEEMNNLLNSREIKMENPVINDFVSMSQIHEQAASVNQPLGLIVEINQNGNNNIGRIEQIGTNMKATLSQNGSSNTADIRTEGENITVNVTQKGNENAIVTDISNFSLESRTAMLEQRGNGNLIELSLLETGSPESTDPQAFIVTQKGNSHQAKITGGVDFNSPIKIDQTGGKGMEIEINTSYFSFPMGK